MNTDCLLIPIQVDAFVVDQEVADNSGWSPEPGDMRRVVDELASPRPPEDGSTEPPPKEKGVYLRWILPPSHRHARGDHFDNDAFHGIPDRWLVVRFLRHPDTSHAGTPDLEAWVIDSRGEGDTNKPANLITPDRKAKRIGKHYASDNFSKFGSPTERKLTAIGNQHTSDITFTTQVTANLDVLSFHDKLETISAETLKTAAISYLVIGWSGDGELYGLSELKNHLGRKPEDRHRESKLAQAIFKALRLDPKDATYEDLKSHWLFHGMITAVNYWHRERYLGRKLGYPGSKVFAPYGVIKQPTKVGIGNNGPEAMAALVADETTEGKRPLWQALETACHGNLAELTSPWDELPHEQELHRHRFQSQTSAVRWHVTQAELPDGKLTRPTGGSSFVSIPDPIAEALKDLNEVQEELDNKERQLIALQRQLYSQWWLSIKPRKSIQDPNPPAKDGSWLPDPQDIQNNCSAIEATLEILSTSITQHKRVRNRKHDILSLILDEHWELGWQHTAPHWHASEPVLAVKGIGWGHDEVFGEPLPWRRLQDIARSATLKMNGAVISSDSPSSSVYSVPSYLTNILGNLKKQSRWDLVPALEDLLHEGGLVERAVSALVDDVMERPTEFERHFDAELDDIRKAMGSGDDLGWRLEFFSAEGKSPIRPSSRLARAWCEQPWSPRFIDWEIDYVPALSDGDDFGPNWKLQGEEYEPSSQLKPSPADGQPVSGRCLLASVPQSWFKHTAGKLLDLLDPKREKDSVQKKLLELFKGDVSNFVQKLNEIDREGVLIQPLGGFHEVLLSRKASLPCPDPSDPIWSGRKGEADPAQFSSIRSSPSTTASTAEDVGRPLSLPNLRPPYSGNVDFSLLRACTILVKQLKVVDDFGQSVDLIHGSGSAGLSLHPSVRLPGLPESGHVALPPRFLQPARLHFGLLTADEPCRETTEHHEDNPICGWVVYNHIDRGLLFYDASGALLGELEVRDEAHDCYSVGWECLMDPVPPDSSIDKVIRNKTLCEFARALYTPDSSENPRLLDVLDLIDQALPIIRPGNPRAGANNSLMAGRPLALMNATLKFRLFGKHAWADPFEPLADPPPTDGTGDTELDKKSLPVRIGCADHSEDSLVGYFNWKDDRPSFSRIVPYEGFSPITKLRLDSVSKLADLEKGGKSLVIVALVNGDLHIRTFDPGGDMVDTTKSDLVAGRDLTSLEDLMKNNPIPPVSLLSQASRCQIIEWALSASKFWQSTSRFVKRPNLAGATAGFIKASKITILADPRGVIQATSGVVPVERVQVPRIHIEEPLRNMELSLRVEPVLVHGEIAVPTPSGRSGEWKFRDPSGENQSVVGIDTKAHLEGNPSLALGGHLKLKKNQERDTN